MTLLFTYNYMCWPFQAKPEDTLDLCRILNNDLADTIKKYPKRFIGLGTLPMQAPKLAVRELKRCVHELGFPGVQIGSHVNDWNLDAPELLPIFEVRTAQYRTPQS
jgi:aminocarboxymuconate-semialdehyde decarboxylase